LYVFAHQTPDLVSPSEEEEGERGEERWVGRENKKKTNPEF